MCTIRTVSFIRKIQHWIILSLKSLLHRQPHCGCKHEAVLTHTKRHWVKYQFHSQPHCLIWTSSKLSFTDGNSTLFNPAESRGPIVSQLSHEVIRLHYINSSYPDMTCVHITLAAQPRAAVTYTCTVYVQLKVISIQRETVTASRIWEM